MLIIQYEVASGPSNVIFLRHKAYKILLQPDHPAAIGFMCGQPFLQILSDCLYGLWMDTGLYHSGDGFVTFQFNGVILVHGGVPKLIVCPKLYSTRYTAFLNLPIDQIRV